MSIISFIRRADSFRDNADFEAALGRAASSVLSSVEGQFGLRAHPANLDRQCI